MKKMDIYKLYGWLNYLNYILWLFEFNVVILAVNLPLLLLLVFGEVELQVLPLLFLVGLSVGPSLLAAFEAVPYIEEGIVKHYFQALKKAWKKGIKFWLPTWFLLIVIAADIIILETYSIWIPLKWVLIAVFIAALMFLVTFFAVWGTWKQETKDAMLLAAKLSLVKPLRCNLNFPILFGTLILFGVEPVYLTLYGAGVGIFLVYKNFRPVIQFVNERPENCGQEE